MCIYYRNCASEMIFYLQEREGFSTTPVAMPTRIAKKGFPTVHQLDSSDLSPLPGDSAKAAPPHPLTGRGVATPPKKKKSLFAQQLESRGLEYFGIEVSKEPGMAQPSQLAFKKDFVEPVAIMGGASFVVNTREEHSESAAGAMGGAHEMEVDDAGGVAREEFESDASQTWKR